MPRVELFPGGKALKSPKDTPLCDILFNEGVEFPCGGLGHCRRCKVRVIDGDWPISQADARVLSPTELHKGWRLACQGLARGNLTLEVAQWRSAILADETPFAFMPAEGLGIAIDLGTTTVAAQLLDLQTAKILSVATALNAQGAHGADVMTRLDFALNGGAAKLTHSIRAQIKDVIKVLLANSGRGAAEVRSVIIVGNTAMHHLFCGLPIDQLACTPFEPYSTQPQEMTGAQLGWDLSELRVSFLPPIGGFVGSDILAGIIATRLPGHPGCVALMDLGTNGEVVVAHLGKILCASTAAGPAFEGARISYGMRAATGAIHSVRCGDNGIHCEVLGGGKARGICGSGLVDAIASGLDADVITSSGRLANGSRTWSLLDEVVLCQKDIRELQLAKASIAAGLHILTQEAGFNIETLDQIHLAGAFGNYINRESASRIGLLPIGPDKVTQAGNTALLGAKLALFEAYRTEFDSLPRMIKHVPLNERADFQESFIDHVKFPERSLDAHAGSLRSIP